MAIDEEVINSVKSVVADASQPESVAKRLIAWLEDESNRTLPHADRIEHLKNLRNAIILTVD